MCDGCYRVSQESLVVTCKRKEMADVMKIDALHRGRHGVGIIPAMGWSRMIDKEMAGNDDS